MALDIGTQIYVHVEGATAVDSVLVSWTDRAEYSNDDLQRINGVAENGIKLDLIEVFLFVCMFRN